MKLKPIKRLTAPLVCLALLAGLAGCGGAPATQGNPSPAAGANGNSGGKLRVVATIFPQYDFVRAIAGDAVELNMLLSPGAEVHSYEPSPQDIITIQNADLFIYVGGESDIWVEEILASMDTGGKTLVALTDIITPKPEERVEGMQGAGHDHSHTDEAASPHSDEHVWTSPKNAMKIVQALGETLERLDKQNAGAFRQNTRNYLDRLQQLDAALEDIVANAARKTLIFGDRFPFRYLTDDYGLEYYAAFPGCSTDTEPSASTVAFLIDKVKAENIPVVFYIEMSNQRMADTICGETGAEKRLLHSCHNLTKDELATGEGYLSLMEKNTQTLKEALQ